MKILVFGASNSIHSLNKKLAYFTATLLKDAEVIKIDLNDFTMPIYGIDLEMAEGIPQKALDFRQLVDDSDGIIISFAEHNGAYSTVFKNIFDWNSRIKGSTWGDKLMLLMATSPGPRGGASVLQIAASRFPFNGGKVVGTFSLPSFNNNFEEGKGITDEKMLGELRLLVGELEKSI